MRKAGRIFFRFLFVLFLLLNFIVAMHAYKFTHFYDRNEITLKTKEERNGWDATKDILLGIKYVKQKNSSPDTLTSSVYLTTKNGLKLEAWYIPAESARGSVAMFHGHGGSKSSLIGEANALRRMGYNTLLVDFRAHGNSEGNTCTIGYKEAEDVKLAFEFLKNLDEKNIVLWGISLGAASITKAVHDYRLSPSSIILEMPFASMTDAVEGRLKIMGLPPQPLAGFLTFWGGVQHGFWAYGLKPSEYVKEFKCPVLLQWGKNDNRVSEKETQLIFKNIASAKTLVVYESGGHGSLYAAEQNKWVSTVSNFLNR